MTRPDADTAVVIVADCRHADRDYRVGDAATLPLREAQKLVSLGRARLADEPKESPRPTTPRKRTRKPRGDAK